MKKFLLILPILFLLVASTVSAHPGRTASDGCHYCRTNCVKWGEVEGARHCHNGGTVIATIKPSTPKPVIATLKPSTPKPTIAPTETPTSAPEVLSVSTEAPQPTATPQIEVQGAQTTNTGWLLPLGLLIVAGPKLLKWLARKTAPTDI